ncbi:MAG TPA: DUF4446 family protein [Candidatus Acidoferrales bacterium]|nr:DUF4446 family protein [Candidatus Acidoferrales bacterium]
MPFASVYAAAGAFAGALVALAVYHYAAVRPALARLGTQLGVHDQLIGGDAGSASGRLARLEAEHTANRAAAERVASRLDELEAFATSDVSRIGFVRYDAFDDTGSDLSYALALLNREGDGVVLTSIYSRTDTRTFGKAVKAFRPAANASEEELRAIELARSSTENG